MATDVGEGPVRLTRRGRVVLVALAATLLLVGFWVTAGRGQEAGASPSVAPSRPREAVIAGDHDTLWAIAVRTRPEVDPRITVQRLIDINGLDDGVIQPGQRLTLPGR